MKTTHSRETRLKSPPKQYVYKLALVTEKPYYNDVEVIPGRDGLPSLEELEFVHVEAHELCEAVTHVFVDRDIRPDPIGYYALALMAENGDVRMMRVRPVINYQARLEDEPIANLR